MGDRAERLEKIRSRKEMIERRMQRAPRVLESPKTRHQLTGRLMGRPSDVAVPTDSTRRPETVDATTVHPEKLQPEPELSSDLAPAAATSGDAKTVPPAAEAVAKRSGSNGESSLPRSSTDTSRTNVTFAPAPAPGVSPPTGSQLPGRSWPNRSLLKRSLSLDMSAELKRSSSVDTLAETQPATTRASRTPRRSPSGFGVTTKVFEASRKLVSQASVDSTSGIDEPAWEFFDLTEGAWRPIADDYTVMLNMAFRDRAKTLDVGQYKYDFSNWTQTCNFSGTSREFRRPPERSPSGLANGAYEDMAQDIETREKVVEAHGLCIFKRLGTSRLQTKPYLVAKRGCNPAELARVVMNDENFRLGEPRAVISVTGGAQNLDITATLRDNLRQDIVDLAQLTSGFLVTGGTDTGCMQLVGAAISAAELDGDAINCIGIAPLGTFHGSHVLKGAHGEAVPEFEPRADPPSNNYARLNPDHTHFILLDTDANPGGHYWGKEVEARASFESHFSKTFDIQLILLVIGGGPGTIDTIISSMASHEPIFIVKDSGGVANILAGMLEGDESVLTRVREDPLLKKHEEKLVAARKKSDKYNVRVIDYSSGDTTAQVILNKHFEMAMVQATSNRLDWAFLLETYIYKFDRFDPVLEAVTNLINLYGSERGIGAVPLKKARRKVILQYVLLTALRHKPLEQESRVERARLIDFVLRRLEEDDDDFDVMRTVMVNELYALRHSLVDPLTASSHSTGDSDRHDVPNDAMTLTLTGWDVNYEPIILTHSDGLRGTMTGQELAELYVQRLRSRFDTHLRGKNSKFAAIRLKFLTAVARKCKLCPPDALEARKSSFMTSTVDTFKSVDASVDATEQGRVVSWGIAILQRLPSVATLKICVLCALVVFSLGTVPVILFLGVLVFTVLSGIRSGSSGSDCFVDLALHECRHRWSAARLTMHCGGVIPKDQESENSQVTMQEMQWWHEIDFHKQLKDQKVHDGSCIMISFGDTRARKSIKNLKMNLQHLKRASRQKQKTTSETQSVEGSNFPLIRLPEDMRQALKLLGLYAQDANIHKELSVTEIGKSSDLKLAAFDARANGYQQLLLWACSIGDEALLDIFWQRTRNPIKSAVLVSSMCDKLVSIHKDSIEKYDSWEERYPHCEQLIQSLSGISQKYRARASRMMASTFAADETKTGRQNAKILGTDWARGLSHNAEWRRLLLVQLAFADNDTDHANQNANGSYVHPALRENTNDFWQSSGRRQGYVSAHIREMINKSVIIVIHYIVCTQNLHEDTADDNLATFAGSSPRTGSSPSQPSSVSLPPLEYVLWLGHTAQSLELLLYRLDSDKHSRTAHSVSFDLWYLFFCQFAHTTRLLAALGLGTGGTSAYVATALGMPPLYAFGSRVLTVAVLSGMISLLLSVFLLFPQARIGTVVEIYWDVVFSADNVAFILLMAAFCVAFSLTIRCVDWGRASEMPMSTGQDDVELTALLESIHNIVSASITELVVPAADYFSAALSVDEDSSGTKDQSVVAQGLFWLFWLFANTYLIQGFLVGIISDNFIQKQQAAEKLLLLQKLELIRCYIQRQQGHIPRIGSLPLYLNFPSTLFKFFYFTDVSNVTLFGWAVGKHLQRWPIIMAVASLNLEDDTVVGERTTRAALRVIFRLLFFTGLLLVLTCSGPVLLLWSLGQDTYVEMDPGWTLQDMARRHTKEQHADHLNQARELEMTALEQWQEFRDEAWNDSSQDVKVAARFEKLERRFSQQEQAMAQLQRSVDQLVKTTMQKKDEKDVNS